MVGRGFNIDKGESESDIQVREKESPRSITHTAFTYLKEPSVLTLKSCMTNQIPILSFVSCSLKALPAQFPIRFLVNIPWMLEVGAPPIDSL